MISFHGKSWTERRRPRWCAKAAAEGYSTQNHEQDYLVNITH